MRICPVPTDIDKATTLDRREDIFVIDERPSRVIVAIMDHDWLSWIWIRQEAAYPPEPTVHYSEEEGGRGMAQRGRINGAFVSRRSVRLEKPLEGLVLGAIHKAS